MASNPLKRHGDDLTQPGAKRMIIALKSDWFRYFPINNNITSLCAVYEYINVCSSQTMTQKEATCLALLFLIYFIRSGTPLVHCICIVMQHFSKFGVSIDELQQFANNYIASVRTEDYQYEFLIEQDATHNILSMITSVVMFAIINSDTSPHLSFFVRIIRLLFEFSSIYKKTTPRNQVFSTWSITSDSLLNVIQAYNRHPYIHILETLRSEMNDTIRKHINVHGSDVMIGSTVSDYIKYLCQHVPRVITIQHVLKTLNVPVLNNKRANVENILAQHIITRINSVDDTLNFRRLYFGWVLREMNIPGVLCDIIIDYVCDGAWYIALYKLFVVLGPHTHIFEHLCIPLER